MRLKLRSDKRKHPEFKEFRYITSDEIMKLECGQHVDFIDRNGDVATAKVNGKIRTWKRDRDRIEIPFKFGMYECFTLNKNEMLKTLVKETKK